MSEPRVLITAIKCDRCGEEVTDAFSYGTEANITLPYECSRYAVEEFRERRHGGCGGRALIATRPIHSDARLSGGFSWMNTVGHGDLDEFLEDRDE